MPDLKMGLKIPYLSFFFGLNLKTLFPIFEISTLKFVELQDFTKKQKSLNMSQKMGQKMPYLVSLG